MKIITIDKVNNDIVIYEEKDNYIESYSLEKTITFENLVKFLLNLNLEMKVTINEKCELPSLSSPEKELISIINNIVDDYNQKVEEFNLFKENKIR